MKKIELRPAMTDDGPFLMDLRNSPMVIAAGDSGRRADASWLDGAIDVVWAPVGYVRFDRNDDGSLQVSIALSREARKQGIGTAALEQAKLRYAKRYPLKASVKLNNKASIRAFEKAGYHEDERSSTHVTFRAAR